jgi:carbonic anhydrase
MTISEYSETFHHVAEVRKKDRYTLVQAVLQSPSQYRLPDGSRLPLELQLLHVDSRGHYLVLSRLFNATADQQQQQPTTGALSAILSELPDKVEMDVVPAAEIDLSSLFTEKELLNVYSHLSPLSYEPCTEETKYFLDASVGSLDKDTLAPIVALTKKIRDSQRKK